MTRENHTVHAYNRSASPTLWGTRPSGAGACTIVHAAAHTPRSSDEASRVRPVRVHRDLGASTQPERGHALIRLPSMPTSVR